MNNNIMPVYLISLKYDVIRRDKLKKCFPVYYDKFIHVEGVDGRKLTAKEYFEKIRGYFIKYNKIMTPGELGCTLSHIKALKEFVETGCRYALVLEDDVIGRDVDLDRIFRSLNEMDLNSVLLCGGQISLFERRYQFGRRLKSIDVYKVARFSYPFVYGTCCYVVTRKSAQQILEHHSISLTLADKWDSFFEGSNTKIYYSNILSHPDFFGDSSIEKERDYIHKKKTINKIFSRKVFSRFLNILILEFKRIVHILLRYKKLPR